MSPFQRRSRALPIAPCRRTRTRARTRHVEAVEFRSDPRSLGFLLDSAALRPRWIQRGARGTRSRHERASTVFRAMFAGRQRSLDPGSLDREWHYCQCSCSSIHRPTHRAQTWRRESFVQESLRAGQPLSRAIRDSSAMPSSQVFPQPASSTGHRNPLLLPDWPGARAHRRPESPRVPAPAARAGGSADPPSLVRRTLSRAFAARLPVWLLKALPRTVPPRPAAARLWVDLRWYETVSEPRASHAWRFSEICRPVGSPPASNGHSIRTSDPGIRAPRSPERRVACPRRL